MYENRDRKRSVLLPEWLSGAIAVGVMGWGAIAPAAAQIVPDASLGSESSVVAPGLPAENSTTLIEGGATRGSNLFHSFETFNVNTGQAVYFANPAAIQNILTRVTGGDVSAIDGLLGVDGLANLYFLNPNGVIFGPNAQLDVRGSFVTSTGSSFTFADGSEFSALPATGEFLSVSVPLGVQFNDQPQGDIRQSGNLAVGADATLTLFGNTVENSGTLTAVGGTVEILGQEVTMTDTAVVEVSGAAGGGTVLIGGDYRGQGPVPNAQQTIVAPGATIAANALDGGDGGTVIVWADDVTQFDGSITAQGGPAGGNGGFAEVSGRETLRFRGTVDLLAPAGDIGTLLLDPTNIEVVAGVDDPTELAANDEFADPGANSTISNATINAATANVVLQATNNITVNAPINIATANVGFTAQANNNIIVNQAIATQNGDVNLLADNDNSGAGRVEINDTITTNGGNVAAIGRDLVARGVDTFATISSGGGDITFAGTSADNTGIAIRESINSGGGNISLTGTSTGADIQNRGIAVNTIANVTSEGGDITFVGQGANGDGVVILGTIDSSGGATGGGTISLQGESLNNDGLLAFEPISSGAGDINLTSAGDSSISIDSATTTSGNISVTGGENAGAALDGGTFTTETGNITLANGITVTAPATFETQAGTIDTTTSSLAVNDGVDLALSAGVDLNLGAIALNGATGTATFSASTATFNQPVTTPGGRAVTGNIGTVNVNNSGSVQAVIDVVIVGGTVSLAAGTYQEGATIVIDRDLTLTGAGDSTILDGQNAIQVLSINGGVTATLSNLAVQNGAAANGAGVFNAGNLILSNASFTNNNATSGGGVFNSGGTVAIAASPFSQNTANNGGGIFNDGGTVTVENSPFSQNRANNNGGAIVSSSVLNATDSILNVANSTFTENTAGNGGAIDVRGDFTIAGSTFEQNDATGLWGGGVHAAGGVSGTIAASTFDQNTALQGGGGIAIRDGAIAITNSTMSNNETTAGDGAGIFSDDANNVVTLDTSTVSGNTASGRGAGVYNAGGTVTLNTSTVSNNTAAQGGGIYNAAGVLTANSSTIGNNSSTTQGGGVFATDNSITLNRTIVAGNTAGSNGGGIAADNAIATINTSTVSDNSTSGGSGGGIAASNGSTVTVSNSTVANNQALAGDGGGLFFDSGTVTLGSSLVTNNTAAAGDNLLSSGGTFTNAGNNLLGASGDAGVVGAAIAPAETATVAASQILAPTLANYGGTTATLGLVPGSPAIDAGNGTTADQRGIAVVNGQRDIGAFESQGYALTVAGGNNQTALLGQPYTEPLTVTVTSPAGEPVEGGTVTFAAPTAGASAALSNTSGILDASGAASTTAIANDIAGDVSVTVEIGGATSAATFDLTNVELTTPTPVPPEIPTDSARFSNSAAVVIDRSTGGETTVAVDGTDVLLNSEAETVGTVGPLAIALSSSEMVALQAACDVGGDQGGSFVITGSGGLPPGPQTPSDAQGIDIPWVVDDEAPPAAVPTAVTPTAAPTAIMDSQLMVVDGQGSVHFVATATPQTLQSFGVSGAELCQAIAAQ